MAHCCAVGLQAGMASRGPTGYSHSEREPPIMQVLLQLRQQLLGPDADAPGLQQQQQQ